MKKGNLFKILHKTLLPVRTCLSCSHLVNLTAFCSIKTALDASAGGGQNIQQVEDNNFENNNIKC